VRGVWRDFSEWLVCMTQHWASLGTGGIFVFLVAIYEKLSGHSLGVAAWVLMFVLGGLVTANFLCWRDEHGRALAANEKRLVAESALGEAKQLLAPRLRIEVGDTDEFNWSDPPRDGLLGKGRLHRKLVKVVNDSDVESSETRIQIARITGDVSLPMPVDLGWHATEGEHVKAVQIAPRGFRYAILTTRTVIESDDPTRPTSDERDRQLDGADVELRAWSKNSAASCCLVHVEGGVALGDFFPRTSEVKP